VRGNAVKVWDVSAAGAPVLVDSILLPASVVTVGDVQVSDDGRLLVLATEGGHNSEQGLYVYALTDPASPDFRGRFLVGTGLHTATVATIGGRVYAFAARNPVGAALLVFDLTDLLP
jgi:hypothetical protein